MPDLQPEVAKDFWLFLGLKSMVLLGFLLCSQVGQQNHPLFCFEWKACCCVALDIYLIPELSFVSVACRWSEAGKDSPLARCPRLDGSPSFSFEHFYP